MCYKLQLIVISLHYGAFINLKICFTEAFLIKPKSTMVAEIIDNIRRIFYVLAEQSRKAEHETGLTGSQLWVIKLLAETSPMKVTDLARRMYLHPATMVGLLDRLEAKGLVQRIRSDRDRRVVHIIITEPGQEIVRNAPEVSQSLLVNGLEPLTDQKVRTVSNGLEQLVTILGVQNDPPNLIQSSEVNMPRKRKKTAD
jgi:DNA-binding MarR family transcriptional regulator